MELRTIDAGGLVHYADFGGEGPRTFVLVHGLGGSLYNWASAAPLLTPHGRVVAPDLAGFGRSPWRPGNSKIYSNKALLGRFLKAISPKPVVLVGNSMGGMISTLQAAHDPSTVEALVLVCPALLPAPPGSHERAITLFFALSAIPGLGDALARRQRARVPPERAVDDMLRLCGLSVRDLDPRVLHLHRELARERYDLPWAIPAFSEAARSLLALTLFQPSIVERAMQRVQAPTLLMQGLRDRLVLPVSSRRAQRLCPHWTLDELPDQGHTPMLQDPQGFTERTVAWLAKQPPR